ncbi:MAG TPA: nitrous oxide reductase accessory protein NosL [Nitrospirota bacterium]|nr:nitrous oxide reductase accessory protein NosL [Nitrospirota bacterium]
MMKQRFIVSILTFILFCMAGRSTFAQSDIEDHRSCAYCGMDRKAYGYSRMLIQYVDGTLIGVCSLHCAVVELDANQGRTVKTFLVADRDTRTLIDAEKAIWVIGGKKRGVMTQQPKWAFQTKSDAEAFIKTNGGKIVSFEEALTATREELVQGR